MMKDVLDGEYVVYPAHGVGRMLGIETQELGGQQVQLLVISFDKDRMVLRLPVQKAKAAGLRALSSPQDLQQALSSLSLKTKARRTMWSRRVQEYETKINSGDLMSIAEVIRDLYRHNTQSDQSYSERQIYQAAVDRFVREISAVEQIEESVAVQKIETFLKAA